MKIIQPGKCPDTTLRFTCKWCGCVFEADDHEYHTALGLSTKGFVNKAYISCPTCSCECSTEVIYEKE